jgi:hypothetical protein
MIEAPSAERRRRGRKPKKVVRVRGRGRRAFGEAPSCAKHPNATEFDKKGKCRQCIRDYQNEYQRKKREAKNGASTPQEPAKRERRPAQRLDLTDDVIINEDELDDDDEGDAPRRLTDRQFVWSKPTRCPKCGEMARLRRLADADLAKDMWIHPGPNCTVKIAHYKIKDDLKYQGEDQ